MTLPVSGAISFNAINVELGVAGTTTASLGQSSYRTLAGVASGAISLSNFYGKSNTFVTSFSGGTNVDLRSTAISLGWNGTSRLDISNNGTITSASTGSAALNISGSFPNGVIFRNNALIIGRGGNGGNGGSTLAVAPSGGGGGTALSVSSAVTIYNNSTISGGGGGGGGGSLFRSSGKIPINYSGGGGGGGIGNSSGGSYTHAGGNYAGIAGTGGTTSAAGTGGYGAYSGGGQFGGTGGNGGSYGSAGANGGLGTGSGTNYGAGSGGAAGACTSGNANITWGAFGNRYGALN